MDAGPRFAAGLAVKCRRHRYLVLVDPLVSSVVAVGYKRARDNCKAHNKHYRTSDITCPRPVAEPYADVQFGVEGGANAKEVAREYNACDVICPKHEADDDGALYTKVHIVPCGLHDAVEAVNCERCHGV